MSTVLVEVTQDTGIRHPKPKRWTREECAQLVETGIPGLRNLELIEGELIDRIGKNRPHSLLLSVVSEMLRTIFGWRFVQMETPIDVSPTDNPTSEPEPDIVVLSRNMQEFQTANPPPSAVALAVEIADSTLSFDLAVKARLYARAGIPEYWVFDIRGRRLIVHRTPDTSQGRYANVLAYDETESLSPLAAPAAFFTVRQAFEILA